MILNPVRNESDSLAVWKYYFTLGLAEFQVHFQWIRCCSDPPCSYLTRLKWKEVWVPGSSQVVNRLYWGELKTRRTEQEMLGKGIRRNVTNSILNPGARPAHHRHTQMHNPLVGSWNESETPKGVVTTRNSSKLFLCIPHLFVFSAFLHDHIWTCWVWHWIFEALNLGFISKLWLDKSFLKL